MYKVLLVDDEIKVLEGLQRHVEWTRYGFEVVSVALDGQDALKKFKLQEPDVVFCDIKMPNMDGLELGRELIKINENTKIVYLTAYSSEKYLRQALQIRAVDYLDKPVSISSVNALLMALKYELDRVKTIKNLQDNKNILMEDLMYRLLYEDLNEKHFTRIMKALEVEIDPLDKFFFVISDQKIPFSEGIYLEENGVFFSLLKANKKNIKELKNVSFSYIQSRKKSKLLEIKEEIDLAMNFYKINKLEGKQIHLDEFELSRSIKDARMYIYDHYSNSNISVKEIAEFVSLSPEYLSSLYREETGKTINQEITELRMKQAVHYLDNFNYKVYEVAEKVGYKDVSYFSKLFKKRYGLSPGKYRNEN